MSQKGNHHQQIQLVSCLSTQMAEILTKMGRFFNEMAQDCIQHLGEPQKKEFIQKNKISKEILDNLERKRKVGQQQLKEPEQKKSLQGKQVVRNHKPKHPVSSFFVFYKEKGQIIARQQGQVLGSKVARVVAQLWRKMSDKEKQPYELIAKQGRIKYEEEMTEYRIKYTDEIIRLKKLKRMAKIKKKELADRASLSQFNKVIKRHQGQIKPLLIKQEQQESEPSQLSYNSSSQSDMNLEDDLSNSIQEQPQNMSSSGQNQLKQKYIQQQVKKQQSFGLLQVNKSQDKQLVQQRQVVHEVQQMLISQPIFELVIQDDQINGILEQKGSQFDKVSLPLEIQQQNPLFSLQHVNFTGNNKTIDKNTYKTQKKSGSDQKQPDEPKSDEIVRPKGPISSFFIFYRDNGRKLSQSLKIPHGPKLIKITSEIWNRMNPEQKQVYEQEAKERRQLYHSKMQELKKKYGSEALMRRKVSKKVLKSEKKKIKNK